MRLLVPATAAAAGSMDVARGPQHIIGTKLRISILHMHDARGPLHKLRCGNLPDEDVKPIPVLIGNRPAEPVALTCSTRKRSFDPDDEWRPVCERALERSSPAKKPIW